MSRGASPAAAALQDVDLAVDSANGGLTVDMGNGLFETVVLTSSGGHVGRRRPIVPAGVAVDALALVAAMVDAFLAPSRAEHLVRQFSPSLACTFHPFASVKRSALRRAAPFRMRGIRPSKPLCAIAIDAVVLPLRDHHVRMRIVFIAVGVTAGMDRQGVRELLAVGELMGE
jgi:hypothetical protein